MDWLSPIGGIFGFIFPFLESFPIMRATLGFVLVFLAPGFAWTFVFFRQINIIERVAFSFGLSIVIVTLSLLVINWLTGLRLNGPNSVLIIVVVTILPLVAYYLKRFIRREREETS